MQGNIAEWKVQEGQSFAAGDIIADVETDKATMGWESQDDGVMAKIIFPAGSQDIEVGTLVALTVDDESELEAAKSHQPGGSAGAAPAAAAEPEAPAASAPSGSGSSFPPHQVWTMPALSPTMTQGNIAKWIKQVGDPVSTGEALVEVETDKATMMWESVDEGFIAKILAPDGTQDIMVRVSILQHAYCTIESTCTNPLPTEVTASFARLRPVSHLSSILDTSACCTRQACFGIRKARRMYRSVSQQLYSLRMRNPSQRLPASQLLTPQEVAGEPVQVRPQQPHLQLRPHHL